ncbi:MAG: GatB/YqeY domain-containing protein [Planctomycetes bacterium]|nr:GatB/YqeY domain-containing protein [Planctomycetota bacterium]
MALKEKWDADLKQAMLAKNEVVRDTLRLLLSEIKKANLQDGKEITPELEMEVLQRAVKQRQQSIAEFEKAARADLVAKERRELDVLLGYMPKQMNEDEVRLAVKSLMAELGVSTKKDLGTVMKALMARHKGQVDGKLANKVLAELLA